MRNGKLQTQILVPQNDYEIETTEIVETHEIAETVLVTEIILVIEIVDQVEVIEKHLIQMITLPKTVIEMIYFYEHYEIELIEQIMKLSLHINIVMTIE
jgi:hypothetical protein